MTKTWITPLRLAVLGTALVTLGFAQMNGRGGSGMMGSGAAGSGTPGTPSGMGAGMGSGMSGGMGSGMQGGMSGMGAGMRGMASGPAVGADGTAYVIRAEAVTTGSQQSVQKQLVAINPSDGKTNWALQIDGTMISQPALAKDGTILLTTSEPNRGASTTEKPALVIVSPTATSARVQARTSIDGDMLSAPVLTPDGQTIYVIGTDMPNMSSGGQTGSAGTTFLYAFYPGTGALKFKVQLR